MVLLGLSEPLNKSGKTRTVKTLQPSFQQLTRILVDEIVSGGLDLDVGLQIAEDGTVRRTVLSMSEQEPTGAPIEFFPGEVLVVSGGARGVTADCIIRMVSNQRRANHSNHRFSW